MYKQGKAVIVSGQTFPQWGAGGGLQSGRVFFPGSGILQIRARGYPVDAGYSAALCQFVFNLQAEMSDNTWDYRSSADLTATNNWLTLISHPIDMSLNLGSFIYNNYDWELSPGNIPALLDSLGQIQLIPDETVPGNTPPDIVPYVRRPPRYRAWMDAFTPVVGDQVKVRGAWHVIYA